MAIEAIDKIYLDDTLLRSVSVYMVIVNDLLRVVQPYELQSSIVNTIAHNIAYLLYLQL